MPVPPSPRQVAQFVETLASTERWLDEHVGAMPLAPDVRGLARLLRKYVRRCRGWLESGRVSSREIDRRSGKIQDAIFAIWRASGRT